MIWFLKNHLECDTRIFLKKKYGTKIVNWKFGELKFETKLIKIK
jgi:hypothetical protein